MGVLHCTGLVLARAPEVYQFYWSTHSKILSCVTIISNWRTFPMQDRTRWHQSQRWWRDDSSPLCCPVWSSQAHRASQWRYIQSFMPRIIKLLVCNFSALCFLLIPSAGCDFTAVDIEQKTALHWTAGNRDAACVQALLDTYPPLLNRQWVHYR